MKNEKSLTRQRYEKYYQQHRKGTAQVAEALNLIYDNEIFDCATLSFDYHDSEFSGWINRQRMSQFTRAKQRYLDGERLLF